MKRNYNTMWKASLAVVLIMMVACGKKGGSKRVAVESVAQKNIIETVTADGKIQPTIEVKVSSEISGEIIALHIKEGDEVKMGELLVEINPDIYQSAYDRAQASLKTSKANMANTKARLVQMKAQYINAEATFERNKKLNETGAISASDFDAARASYEVAKAEVEAAEQSLIAAQFTVESTEATVKEAYDNLRKTKIYAPVNGTVYALNVEQGERVVGTSQMAGTELFRVADLDAMEVSVDVNENDIIRVKIGDTANIEVDAYLKDVFKGVVTEIANSANNNLTSTDQVTNFNVKIKVLSSSYAHISSQKGVSPFRPGMSASVEVETAVKNGVIAVPIQSVTIRKPVVDSTATGNNEEGIEVVFIHEDGKAKQVAVKTGIQDDNYIEILDGLKEGVEVVSSPFRVISKDLENDTEVRVVDKSRLFISEEE